MTNDTRRVLLVLAHPLPESFAASLAAAVRETLTARGCEVDFLDLYAEGFDPRLTAAERRGYFAQEYDTSGVKTLVERLRAAPKLVLVFPQWWFGFPAILKGFFDRVFAPGVAFAHALDRGRIEPRLTHVEALWAVTTTGSPWWFARIYSGDPVRKLLRRGVAPLCAPGVSFRMLCLHDMDRADDAKRTAFLQRVRAAFEAF